MKLGGILHVAHIDFGDLVAHGVVVNGVEIVAGAGQAPVCHLVVALAAEVVAQSLVVQGKVAWAGRSRIGRCNPQILNSLRQIVAVKLKVTEKAIKIESLHWVFRQRHINLLGMSEIHGGRVEVSHKHTHFTEVYVGDEVRLDVEHIR